MDEAEEEPGSEREPEDEEDPTRAGPGERHSRRPLRRLKHALSQAAVRLLGALLPWLYVAYCWFVWKTSRVVDGTTGPLSAVGLRHGRVVALLWHQEVFTVAWGYHRCRPGPHTLASTGNFGHLVTRLLERCGFVVFRGGSSRGTARRVRVLPTMIRHMREEERGLIYGITVDGSNGPPFRLKPGGPMIARACRAPIWLTRTWCARRLELPTWDRTVIPLPWNRIVILGAGPYWIEPDCSAEEFQRAVLHLEQELLAMADRAARVFDPAGDQHVLAAFPPGWEPAARPLRHHPLDLRTDAWPEWASMAGPLVNQGGDRSAGATP